MVKTAWSGTPSALRGNPSRAPCGVYLWFSRECRDVHVREHEVPELDVAAALPAVMYAGYPRLLVREPLPQLRGAHGESPRRLTVGTCGVGRARRQRGAGSRLVTYSSLVVGVSVQKPGDNVAVVGDLRSGYG